MAGSSEQKRAARDFNKVVRAALTKRGITFIGTTWLPGPNGSFANGQRGYILDDRGTQRIRDHKGVLELASR